MISVIIPAYNEENSIGTCLKSLCAQETSRPFEVIIVNNGSTDGTRDVVELYTHRLNLRIVTVHSPGRGNARFFGFKEAKGDLLLSLDADIVAPPDWIESYAHLFEQPDINAVTGPYCIRDSAWHINTIYNLWIPICAYVSALFIGTFALRGGNFAIRRNVYMKAGQFDPNVDVHDDLELSLRVRKHHKILYMQRICVETSGRRLSRGLFRGGIEYVTGFIRMFLFGERYVRLSNAR